MSNPNKIIKKEINKELYKLCPDCKGECEIHGEVCERCNGTGFIYKNHPNVKPFKKFFT